MNNLSEKEFGAQIRKIASAYPYPDTPDISNAVIQLARARTTKRWQPRRRWMWIAATSLVILITIALIVPPVRAQILEYLQIGAIRVFTTRPTVTPTPLSLESETPGAVGSLPTALPVLSERTFPSLDDLAGETTLEQARSELRFSIPLPAYPAELGPPDRVFLQDFEGKAVLLVWTTPEHPDHILLDLLILGPGTFAQKAEPEFITHTIVAGRPALWIQGQHYLHLKGNTYQNVSLVVEGNILIWEQDGITYRLESDLSLEEAVKIAESLE